MKNCLNNCNGKRVKATKTLANTFIYSIYERLLKGKLIEKWKYKNEEISSNVLDIFWHFN